MFFSRPRNLFMSGFCKAYDEFRERYARFELARKSENPISFKEAMTEDLKKSRHPKPKRVRTEELLITTTASHIEAGGEVSEQAVRDQTPASLVAGGQATLQKGAPLPQLPYLTKEFLLEASTPGGEPDVCMICNHSLPLSWANHIHTPQHRITASTFTILLNRHRGQDVDQIFRAFTGSALLHPAGYYVCPELVGQIGSVADMAMKLRSVLSYLRRERVLQYSMSLVGMRACFEQMERLGDLVLTPIISDVLGSIFDVDTEYNLMPILAPGLSNSQTHYGSITDAYFTSNLHLEYAFDRLDLSEITEISCDSSRLEGKGKADVMEAILGELQLFLWACEADPVFGDWSQRQYVEAHHHPLITLAEHAKNVLVGLVVLVFMRVVIENCVPMMRKYEETIEKHSNMALRRIPKLATCESYVRREFRPVICLAPHRPPQERKNGFLNMASAKDDCSTTFPNVDVNRCSLFRPSSCAGYQLEKYVSCSEGYSTKEFSHTIGKEKKFQNCSQKIAMQNVIQSHLLFADYKHSPAKSTNDTDGSSKGDRKSPTFSEGSSNSNPTTEKIHSARPLSETEILLPKDTVSQVSLDVIRHKEFLDGQAARRNDVSVAQT